MRQIDTALLQRVIDDLGKRGLEKLAVKTELSPSTLNNLLKGKQENPSLETIAKLCQGTGLEFEKLFPLVDDAA